MLRVLLVDDKPVFLIKMKRMKLWQEGVFSIAGTASDGQEALDFLRTAGADILITDIKMPVMDGLELLKICKAENLCGCMILMSSYDDFSYARSALIHGAFDYILKPLEEQSVRDVLKRYLQTLCAQKPSQKDFREIAALLARRENRRVVEMAEKYPDHDKRTVSGQLENILEEYAKERPELQPYLSVPQLLYDAGVSELPADGRVTLKELLEFLTGYIDKLSPLTDSPAVSQVIRYCLEHIEGNIHTFDLADKLFANRQYLSSVFFQETSIHLSEYIRWLKIARAKCLIPRYKVYEIADRLGFRDAEYFSKIFCGYTGCTPREYKKRISEAK